jgi:hypothetical protein
MIIDGRRVDGRMFFGPTTIERAGWKVSNGLMIVYKKLPPEAKKNLVDWVNSGKVIKSATCAVTTCKVLFDIATFDKAEKNYLFSEPVLKHLLFSDVHIAGSPSSPQVYTVNTDFSTVWRELPTWKNVPSFFFRVLYDVAKESIIRSVRREQKAK